ncbi:hypothetical protein [Rhizobium terrae]|uniref:hypothetical protein n=1 Tax=Rhizobium terrae TaxID=2171756 RepID=UPI000E3E157B|nr:hypothetical protein [Rhizobium terrae]
MRAYCGHCHDGFDANSGTIRELFWTAVALVARLWLAVALEMLRRSGPEWKREAEPKGRASIPIANDNG